jgi:TetR/AcrR family transcriptional repressor of nem operon
MPRQKEFDPDQALADAMNLFWEKGYEATSVQDLVDRMGINRFSLYDTFGNKHDLFLRALESYRDQTEAGPIASLSDSVEGLGAIRAYFSAVLDSLSEPGGKRSCFMVNSLAEKARTNAQINNCVMKNVASLEGAFKQAVDRAKNLDEIDTSRDSQVLAEFLVTGAFGMIVLGKGRVDRNRLERTVETMIGALT